MSMATVSTEPDPLERLEVIESLPEPAAVDATDIVVTTDELLTSNDAFES